MQSSEDFFLEHTLYRATRTAVCQSVLGEHRAGFDRPMLEAYHRVMFSPDRQRDTCRGADR